MTNHPVSYSYWGDVWAQFKLHPFGIYGLWILSLFCLTAIFAPFLASSKPLFVCYDGHCDFPLFRYLFYQGFYTKHLDIFFNLFILTFPLFLLFRKFFWIILLGHCMIFAYLVVWPISDPAADAQLNQDKQQIIQTYLKQALNPALPIPAPYLNWQFELDHMSSLEKLNLLVSYKVMQQTHERLSHYSSQKKIESRWAQRKDYIEQRKQRLEGFVKTSKKEDRQDLLQLQKYVAELNTLQESEAWLAQESGKLKWMIMPIIRAYHWEEDAAGDRKLNRELPWWELTRIHRKDLLAALIFGVRISLVVGLTSVAIALAIGLPIGALAGFYGGVFDVIVCRLIEIWESMPIFFMLLLVIAMMQSKSIFLVISVIGLFSWTSFCRYTRGEFFKQRNLPYVEACHAMGYSQKRTIFFHILPNAVPPLLTLMPFAIMGAITSEAGLSFLGLGEEGSCSWGVLMDEGRSAFPEESYLLYPSAILLTTLLVAIAVIGDALRDAVDPKMHR